MIDKYMQSLLDAPLADANKINLPEGKRPARKRAKAVYEGSFAPDALTPKQVRERRAKAEGGKAALALDYYAGTDVPVERIAVHLGMTEDRVVEHLIARGRNCGKPHSRDTTTGD